MDIDIFLEVLLCMPIYLHKWIDEHTAIQLYLYLSIWIYSYAFIPISVYLLIWIYVYIINSYLII